MGAPESVGLRMCRVVAGRAQPGDVREEPSVLHLDADAFFAAVEQRQRPSLRGRPVIVGGLGPRGVVATASYEARRFGVGSAMPTARARSLCPAGTYLIPRFAAYSAHSAVLMELLREASPLVQPISLDEAFVDLAAGGHADPLAVADHIRREFWRRTGLVVSIGLGRSKLIAKLASEAGKPHGWTVITAEQEDGFLLPTPVGKLGVLARPPSKRCRESAYAPSRNSARRRARIWYACSESPTATACTGSPSALTSEGWKLTARSRA